MTFVEKPDGMYEFAAELSNDQCQFLLQYALQILITQGLVPFVRKDIDTTALVVEEEPKKH